MSFIVGIDHPSIDDYGSQKIRGYKTIWRLRKYAKYGLSCPAPIPTPFFVSSPLIFHSLGAPTVKRARGLMRQRLRETKDRLLSDVYKILKEKYAASHDIICFRIDSEPFVAHSPNIKVNLSEAGWQAKVTRAIDSLLSFAKERAGRYREMCFYIHPWVEPVQLVGSVEIITTVEKDGMCTLTATYGSGYGLEFGGDKYIVDTRNRVVKKRTIVQKLSFARVFDADTGKFYGKPKRYTTPTSRTGLPVISDDDAVRIASMYASLEKGYGEQIVAHWTRKVDGEEYTIDFTATRALESHTMPIALGTVLQVVELASIRDSWKIGSNANALYVVRPTAKTDNLEDIYDLIARIDNGVIASPGGHLSHPAILAREKRLPYLSIDEEDLPKEGTRVRVHYSEDHIGLEKVD